MLIKRHKVSKAKQYIERESDRDKDLKHVMRTGIVQHRNVIYCDHCTTLKLSFTINTKCHNDLYIYIQSQIML